MKPTLALLTALLLAPPAVLHAADDKTTWLLQYDAQSVPEAPWSAIGKPVATIDSDALSLKDDSTQEIGAFEAEWNGDLDGKEIIVEARVKQVSMVGHRDSPTATWPQRDGAPIRIQLSDGKHEEGILLTPPQDKHPEAAKGYVRTLTDRFAHVNCARQQRDIV